MLPKNLLFKRDPVKLFSILFPRLTREEALSFLISQVKEKQGCSVCFPDMSTLNLAAVDPKISALIENSFLPLNDGAGLELAARLKRLPFLENLNGTDFIPEFLSLLPQESKIYLVGSKRDVAAKTLEVFKNQYPLLHFLGASHGYLSEEEEKILIANLIKQKPNIVLVGMGNPLQLQWIQKTRNHPDLSSVIWLAVGGLFDFYGGSRPRAPMWMRRARLEWLHIVWNQPEKVLRYFAGIPKFLWYCCTADR